MDTFNDNNLSPQELQMLALQFMGQHLTGELKELDKNLVNKTNTLKGMELDPHAVLNSITSVVPPQAQALQQPAPTPVAVQPAPVEAPVQLSFNAPQPTPTLAPAIANNDSVDSNQLEFNFNTSPYTETVFRKLSNIEEKLGILLSIEERLAKLESVIPSICTKKKD